MNQAAPPQIIQVGGGKGSIDRPNSSIAVASDIVRSGRRSLAGGGGDPGLELGPLGKRGAGRSVGNTLLGR